ncbi:carboxymuconolactone decarboxylase family protein [Amycolatopsis sp. H20-H5]|uniref:carboxymuconolactone decarboxylase family protein n=1 Tax=Amycolatopsis sp. H20-H5 TaxID=3046309 RepID=UPI002DB9E304|nr:carboxymuconolactone decarboxylase family protein [Amycolatopsis sp. H20-H5]MEC3981963.1 carboxymuconolactone decarboxylase family protein [Amycolatopsis sp. H20-H5]
MARIPAVTTAQAGPLLKLLYRFAVRRYGAVPEPFAIMAHHPGLLRTGGVHELLVEKAAKTLPANVRELAQFRVATRLGCSWCVDFATMLQLHSGLDIERLKSIDDYATSPAFSAGERLALAYADAMTTSPVTVTGEQTTALEREFGRKGLLELTYLVALENMRGRINTALEVTAQGFTSGDACQVPMP